MLAIVLAPMVVLASPPAHSCGVPQATSTANHAPLHARKLGDLPDAEMDYAVVRSVGGCWVRQVARFHVSSPAASDASEPGAQVPGYAGRMVPEGPARQPLERVAP